MVYGSSVADHLRVEVKHRCPAPNRYTWEIVPDMNLFHWKNPEIGSAHGKRQVKLERKRWKKKHESVERTH